MLYLFVTKQEEPLLVADEIEAISQKVPNALPKIFFLTDMKSFEEALFQIKTPSLFEAEDYKIIHVFVLSEKLYEKIQKNNHLKSLSSQHMKVTTIKIYPVTLRQFPIWVKNHFRKAGFQCSPAVISLLSTYCEGNIYAAHQCLEKLKLCYPDAKNMILTEKQVGDHLIFSVRYTVFDLMDKLSPAHRSKIPMMLQTLKDEGIEPAIVLWGLAKSCRQKNMPQVLPILVKADEAIKGFAPGNSWNILLQASLILAEGSLY